LTKVVGVIDEYVGPPRQLPEAAEVNAPSPSVLSHDNDQAGDGTNELTWFTKVVHKSAMNNGDRARLGAIRFYATKGNREKEQ
jgi:succinyl-CoA synthetase beta subunit